MQKLTVSAWACLALSLCFVLALAALYNHERKSGVEVGYRITMEPQVVEQEAAEKELINVNTADVEELSTLTGIGPGLAQRIIEYRTAHGDFQSKEELLEVEGIGSGRLSEIWGEITLTEPETDQ